MVTDDGEIASDGQDFELRYRRSTRAILDHTDPDILAAYRGFNQKKQRHKYEWRVRFKTQTEKAAFFEEKRRLFDTACETAELGACLGEPSLLARRPVDPRPASAGATQSSKYMYAPSVPRIPTPNLGWPGVLASAPGVGTNGGIRLPNGLNDASEEAADGAEGSGDGEPKEGTSIPGMDGKSDPSHSAAATLALLADLASVSNADKKRRREEEGGEEEGGDLAAVAVAEVDDLAQPIADSVPQPIE